MHLQIWPYLWSYCSKRYFVEVGSNQEYEFYLIIIIFMFVQRTDLKQIEIKCLLHELTCTFTLCSKSYLHPLRQYSQLHIEFNILTRNKNLIDQLFLIVVETNEEQSGHKWSPQLPKCLVYLSLALLHTCLGGLGQTCIQFSQERMARRGGASCCLQTDHLWSEEIFEDMEKRQNSINKAFTCMIFMIKCIIFFFNLMVSFH